jgi:hypothetical protein
VAACGCAGSHVFSSIGRADERKKGRKNKRAEQAADCGYVRMSLPQARDKQIPCIVHTLARDGIRGELRTRSTKPREQLFVLCAFCLSLNTVLVHMRRRKWRGWREEGRPSSKIKNYQ